MGNKYCGKEQTIADKAEGDRRMTTNVYESTVSMLKEMPENDLMVVREFIKRLVSKGEVRNEMYNPYKPFTREEVIEQLTIARKHADEGKIMEAYEASSNIRKKYGL